MTGHQMLQVHKWCRVRRRMKIWQTGVLRGQYRDRSQVKKRLSSTGGSCSVSCLQWNRRNTVRRRSWRNRHSRRRDWRRRRMGISLKLRWHKVMILRWQWLISSHLRNCRSLKHSFLRRVQFQHLSHLRMTGIWTSHLMSSQKTSHIPSLVKKPQQSSL